MCLFCGNLLHTAPEGDVSAAPPGALDNDARGTVGPNGKPSLTSDAAGAHLGRRNVTWNGPDEATHGRGVHLTYDFRTSAPDPMPNGTSGFSPFNDQQIAQTLLALQSWADVANVTFSRMAGSAGAAQLLFANYASGTQNTAAFTYLPNPSGRSTLAGDGWYNSSYAYNLAPEHLKYGRAVLTHEIGHALGLLHPGDYDASRGPSGYAADASYFEDSRQYSTMSYWSERNTGGSFGAAFASAPMIDDIAALQRFHGANLATRTGNDVYGFNSNTGRDFLSAANGGPPPIFAVWDAGGTDTFDFSLYAQDQTVDLNDGAFSNVGGLVGNVSIARGVLIENALGGAGDDRLIGNEAANLLRGNGGDDILFGGAGSDHLDGGAGQDTAVFAAALSATAHELGTGMTVLLRSGNEPGAVDRVENVERLQFADGAVRLDHGNALFDALHYMRTQADVYASGQDAMAHFRANGAAEGRDPNPFFDVSGYLAVNPDIARAGLDPLDHYAAFGAAERRDTSLDFDTRLYLQFNPDVAASRIDPLEHFLRQGRAEGRDSYHAIGETIGADGFDASFYLFANPDVAAARVDPRQHYATSGFREGRDPNALFDTAAYLRANPDVAAARIDPLGHYDGNGWREGRDASAAFQTAAYLGENADIAAAGINPLAHFLRYGVYEGRGIADFEALVA